MLYFGNEQEEVHTQKYRLEASTKGEAIMQLYDGHKLIPSIR